jgi:cyanophycinase
MDVHLIGGGWDDSLGLVGGHELVVERVPEGSPFDEAALDGVDGLFVGGGPTPQYHASLAGAYARIRSLVGGGMPYAGFSAGAAIAGSHAVIGGWRIDGAPSARRTATRTSTPWPWSRGSAS